MFILRDSFEAHSSTPSEPLVYQRLIQVDYPTVISWVTTSVEVPMGTDCRDGWPVDIFDTISNLLDDNHFP